MDAVASAQSLVSQTEFQGGQHDQTRRIRIKLDLKLYLSKVKISQMNFLQPVTPYDYIVGCSASLTTS